MKEKLSESIKTNNLPKVNLNLEENRNKPPEAIHLPKPTGWRILVLPFQPKRVTKGGVHISDTAAERQHVATVCGLVLEVGPDCYRDKSTWSVVQERRLGDVCTLCRLTF